MFCFRYDVRAALIALAVPFVMAPEACPVAEVCDGVDNDGDGLIDEGFDVDGDGYLDMAACSFGTDCNDLDPDIHPNTAEPADGVDNDCDGKIDEAQSTYILRFLAYYSEMPVSGIPVWLGADGQGPVFRSDLNGEVLLYLEQELQDWSFGYSYERTSSSGTVTEYRRIYSYQNDKLDPETTLHVLIPELDNRERVQVTGSTSGIDPALSDNVVWWNTNLISHGTFPSAETMPFDVEATIPGYLLTQQDADPYPLEEGDPYSNMPLAFDLALNPAATTDLALEQSFDQRARYTFRNVDPRMTQSVNDLTLYLPDNIGSLYFYDLLYPLTAPEAAGMDFPSLTGSLQGSELLLSPTVTNDEEGIYQWIYLNGSGRSDVYIADFPGVPRVAPYPAVSRADLPGTTLEISGDENADADLVAYFDYLDYPDVGRRLYHGWYTYQFDTTKKVVFPEIPAGACLWNEEPGDPETADIILVSATAGASYYATDEGTFAGSGASVRLDIAGQGVSRRVRLPIGKTVLRPGSRLPQFMDETLLQPR